MHVGIVTRNVGHNDGQGRVNREIAVEALRRGHEVTLFCETADTELLARPGMHAELMPAPALLRGRILVDQVTAFRARARVARSRCDVIVANGFSSWGDCDLNAVHFVHSSWVRSASHPWAQSRSPRSLYARLYSGANAALERGAFRRARRIVAVSAKVRDELVGIGVDADRIEVILNGVDTAEFTPGPPERARFGLPEAGPVALFAGDLRTPRKNLDTVLAALARVPSLVLAVAGRHEGTIWPELASRLGVADRVRFLGFQRDMPAVMRAAQIFVFPSRYEACSLVLLEAMASGLAVVTASSAGGAELVTPEMGVVLEDSDDVAALAAALAAYVDDPARLEAHGREARLIAERHPWDAMAGRYLDLLAAARRVRDPARAWSGTQAGAAVAARAEGRG